MVEFSRNSHQFDDEICWFRTQPPEITLLTPMTKIYQTEKYLRYDKENESFSLYREHGLVM